MLSQTAEYAVRAVVYLGQQAEPVTIHDIAVATEVPAAYLAKVLRSLATKQIVRASRGIYGGYMLRVPPAELSLYDIVVAVDPLRHESDRFLPDSSPNQLFAPMFARCEEAKRQFGQVLKETRLSDVLAQAPRCTGEAISRVSIDPSGPISAPGGG